MEYDKRIFVKVLNKGDNSFKFHFIDDTEVRTNVTPKDYRPDRILWVLQVGGMYHLDQRKVIINGKDRFINVAVKCYETAPEWEMAFEEYKEDSKNAP